ncbi:hypothetical protein ACFP1L_07640 [Lactiplantibacillus nangangensis]|uniref:Integral membrane protein n=1 Tax=Lactiplantibacillus nangangensis TaxID=2559917 RepID=A0ABW1SK65_9LACO|nr:hypothetical protein [Lactiplantibacillus nangangensis]
MTRRLSLILNRIVAVGLCAAVFVATFLPVHFFADQDWAATSVRLSLTVALIIISLGLRAWVQHWSAVTYRRVLWGVGAVLLVAQLVVAISWVDVSRADAFFVRNQAVALATGSRHWDGYFAVYPNNVSETLFVSGWLKLALKLGLNPPWIWFNIGRFLWLDLGLLAGLSLMRHWRHWQPGALGLLVVWLFAVPIYAYGLFDYTDVWVMPLVVMMAALGVAFGHYQGWRRWLIAVSMWVLLGFGVVLKSNLIVLWLAAVMIVAVAVGGHRLAWRTGLSWLVGCGVTLALCFGASQAIAKQAGYQKDANAAVPATSWIAMSLRPQSSGQYNYEDFTAVREAPTATAKRQLAAGMIKTRLQQLGFGGFLAHLGKKFRVFYATGDFDSFKLTTQWLKAPNWFLVHQRGWQFWLVTWTQSGYLVLLLGAIRQLWRHTAFRLSSGLFSLTVLGLTLFHVGLWEVEARYALPLLPVLMLLGVSGWVTLPTSQLNSSWRWPLSGVALLVTIYSGWQLWQTSQSVTLTTTMVLRQGNGTYFQPTSRVLSPGQRVKVTWHSPIASHQLRLAPTTQTGKVRIQLQADKRVIWIKTGSPRQLRRLTYQPTKAPLTLTIRNLGTQPVKYAAVKSNYDQQTGRILTRPQWFLQTTLRQNETTRPLLKLGTISLGLAVTLALALLSLWLIMT